MDAWPLECSMPHPFLFFCFTFNSFWKYVKHLRICESLTELSNFVVSYNRFVFLLFLLLFSRGTMLPRSMRTGGYDLPGVESSAAPLIGYRPLMPDSGTPSSRPGSLSNESETSHVSVFFPLLRLAGSRLSFRHSSIMFPTWWISPLFPQQRQMTVSLTQPKGDQEKFS